jgi:phage shock protein A
MGELQDSGTFDDLTTLGPAKDDIDRQLEQLSSGGAVDDELAKMKAEIGGGSPPPAELDAPAAEPEPAPAAADAGGDAAAK